MDIFELRQIQCDALKRNLLTLMRGLDPNFREEDFYINIFINRRNSVYLTFGADQNIEDIYNWFPLFQAAVNSMVEYGLLQLQYPPNVAFQFGLARDFGPRGNVSSGNYFPKLVTSLEDGDVTEHMREIHDNVQPNTIGSGDFETIDELTFTKPFIVIRYLKPTDMTTELEIRDMQDVNDVMQLNNTINSDGYLEIPEAHNVDGGYNEDDIDEDTERVFVPRRSLRERRLPKYLEDYILH